VADRRHPVFGKKMSWLGKMAGAADYVIIGEKGGVWIEVKSSKGKLSPDQQFFKDWCGSVKCPYYCVTSQDEVEGILKEHDLMETTPA
jgi:hypothetical protein